MRKPFQTVLHIFSFLLVLTAVFAVGRQGSVACAADRMYTFNMGFDGMQGNLILVESDGQWGLVDTGHRSADTIQDANGRIISVPASEQYSNQISMRNGKDVAQYMVNVLGVRHLDFIVGTHSHMDHIGGVPEIATTAYTDADGRTRYLVDNNTTYFYKEYQHIADFEDDLARYSDLSWHNQAYYYQATKTMQNMGANMVDVSRQQVIHGDPGNAYGDYVTFTMGNMSFRLYNVYEQTNTGSENVNSIVTVMTNGDYTVVNLSDINTGNAAIDNTSRAIGKDFGAVDVVVAGHHGYAGSNTKVMFDSLQPDYVVISNDSGTDSWLYTTSDLAAAIPYAQGLFGTKFFSTAFSPYAIVTDFSGNQVFVYNLEGNGALTDAFYKLIRKTDKTGWVSWVNTNETLWAYLENGKAKRNAWQRYKDDWYYLGADGLMQTGWVDGGRYFCRGDGTMVTGWQMIDGSWYFFRDEGAKITNGWTQDRGKWYFLGPDGVMQTGWVDGGRYYCRPSGVMVTGWQMIDGSWYYLRENGGKIANGWFQDNNDWYYFNADGIMQTGWVDGDRYYCKPNGAMAHDCWQDMGGWYYFKSSGAKAAGGWFEIDNEWYFFDAEGVMQTGWVDNDRYYCKPNGPMAHDCWLEMDGKWFYFKDGGAKAAGGWTQVKNDWYFFDAEGVMQTGWVDNDRYFCKPSGEMARDCWMEIDGHWYCFTSEGAKAANGWNKIGEKWYFLDDNGIMQTGWVDGDGFYCNPDGAMVTGWQNIDGNWYYFDKESGKKAAGGWKEIDHNWYFFDADGVMQTDWLDVDGATYYLKPGGEMVTGWQKIGDFDYYFGSDGVLARNTVIDGYTVNADGVWIP